MGVKRKSYTAHEREYRRMRAEGVLSWNERQGLAAVEGGTKRFLCDVFEQNWAATSGRVVELGCGTGPLLRWLAGRKWRGAGVDISRTAIGMARGQSEGLDVEFHVGDVTRLPFADGAFDLAVDGHCFHCLTAPEDREAFITEAKRVLRPGGCLVLFTMARPVLVKSFQRVHGHYRSGVVYRAMADAARYEGAMRIGGEECVPIRYLEHRKAILRMLGRHGLRPMVLRVNRCSVEEPLSYLSVAARKA